MRISDWSSDVCSSDLKENRGMNRDAMIMVRSGLLDRIDAIAAQSGSLKLAQLCEQVDAIRHIARVHDLRPVEQFASTLESALALDGHGAMVLSYLDLMRDAVARESVAQPVVTACAAALSQIGRAHV